MSFIRLTIPEIIIFNPKKFGDHRGFFSEVYNENVWKDFGIELNFVQDNHSLSGEKGTIRGLHYQAPPFAQDKLVRVIRGAVFDVAVDIRKGSPTFGQSVSATISAQAWNQILVPKGFAHGFCTLEPDTEVIYKVTDIYAPDHDFGLRWNDPALGIEWPVDESEVILSDKDKVQPTLAQIDSPFTFKAA